ncbi:hypothetical protein BVRB_1g006360 [Beta vulgaris subsp. vulgaris]|nr:hypothetical protein BVRB_1g006360 [Beta vulgaris subsp. vulgaris]
MLKRINFLADFWEHNTIFYVLCSFGGLYCFYLDHLSYIFRGFKTLRIAGEIYSRGSCCYCERFFRLLTRCR